MIEDGRVVLTLVALLVGAGGGAWTAHRLWRRRFETKLRGVTSALQQQHQVVLDRFRSAHAKLHSDLEQHRAGTARQMAAAAVEPRAAVQRLEERLKVAYAELDRVREASGAKPLRHTNLDTQGFAATQPMHPGM